MKHRVCFAEENSHWSEYIADDGTRFRVRLVLVSVMRCDSKLPDGQHMHELNFQQVVEQIAPEGVTKITELKKTV